MKPFLSILIIAAGAAACSPATVSNPTTPGVAAYVIDVQDGDSLVVEINGSEEKVRLIGINAPEYDECFGPESATGLRDLIADTEVQVVPDVEARDQYGRLLGYVYREGTLINEEMARRGLVLARAFQPNTALQERLDAAAQEARDNERGMWSPNTCVSTSGTSVAVTEIEPNPSGPDEENLNGEWVVIANTGTTEIDVSGWTLRDASSVHRYLFPAGTTLAPGADLTVHTGCGVDEVGRRYWCADGPVWGNDGDSALLLDTEGHTAATLDY
ncbi:MAG: lamin tail domain-containing protein [Acidimicrobiia bacterium]|nr:lamin tail domain-containing protein [Acidimicrobiia bacterium]MDH3396921.1 lamin tail domain-containing protein [Acidimicrobiia bacterium]MDH5616327.1 lamin tail domain-containing protein [Acidimicrobiia bacterium]